MTTRQKQAFAEHLMANMTWPEKILWARLRSKQIGYSFQRQAIVFGFIVDFWCPTAKVVIEVDGAVHDFPDKKVDDEKKDALLTKSGIEVLRFDNKDIYRGMSAVLIRIWECCDRRAPIKPPLLLKRANLRHRREDSSEFVALRAVQERKRLTERSAAFAQRYQAKREEKIRQRREERYFGKKKTF